jgi:hypothetical protein
MKNHCESKAYLNSGQPYYYGISRYYYGAHTHDPLVSFDPYIKKILSVLVSRIGGQGKA